MRTKTNIIDNMCYAYRHDFGLLDEKEKESIKLTMSQIYKHCFYPILVDLMEKVDCGCSECVFDMSDMLHDVMHK